MVLKVSHSNNVKVYHVSGSGQGSLPDWLVKKRKASLKKDTEWRNRVEIVQDFEFPEASIRLKMTRDEKHLVATGVYKPQIRVFDLAELSMKFDRHSDAENVEFQILSEDWTKLAFLQADRTIEIHSQGGVHYKTRIPKFGRDLAYDGVTCDLLAVGSSNEVYRLNLDHGRFMSSLETSLESINVCRINPVHNLYAFGGESGLIEYWDPRVRQKINSLDVSGFVSSELDVTAFEYMNDGLTYSVGTSSGHCMLFDLRQSKPSLVKDHQYGYPIKKINFHSATNNMVVADTKIVKIWDKNSGDMLTSIEPPYDINDVLLQQGTGMIMMANEGIELQTYYVPTLGPAPKWCAFLDNITEELEENPVPVIYDDYKFLTRKEVSQLNLGHLIGTNVLRAYMHGFFIDQRLYEKAKLIHNPFAFDDYKKNRIKEKIEAQRESRIGAIRKLPAVNKNLAEKMIMKNGDNPVDERFKELFVDPDFEVDENSKEYLLHHPNLPQPEAPQADSNVYQHQQSSESESSDSDLDSDDDLRTQIRKENKKDRKREKPQKREKPKHAASSQNNLSELKSKLSFQDRLKLGDDKRGNRERKVDGAMQVSFKVQKPEKKYQPHDRRQMNPRGVGDLNLKSQKPFYKRR